MMGHPAWVNHDHNPNYIMKNTIIALAASAIALGSVNAQNLINWNFNAGDTVATAVLSDGSTATATLTGGAAFDGTPTSLLRTNDFGNDFFGGNPTGGSLFFRNVAGSSLTVSFSVGNLGDILYSNIGSPADDPNGPFDPVTTTLSGVSIIGTVLNDSTFDISSGNLVSQGPTSFSQGDPVQGAGILTAEGRYNSFTFSDFQGGLQNELFGFAVVDSPVPEPSSALLLGLGAFGLLGRRKR